MLSLLICMAAFAALALGTERTQSEIFGRRLPAGRTTSLQATGWALLLASLSVAIGTQGWGLGLVSYSGHTSLGAGMVYLVLIALQRRKPGPADR